MVILRNTPEKAKKSLRNQEVVIFIPNLFSQKRCYGGNVQNIKRNVCLLVRHLPFNERMMSPDLSV